MIPLTDGVVVEPESRRKISEATYSLLREKAASEVRLRDVAERAGVSHQTIYNLVGNTDQLLAAVLNDYVARTAAKIVPMLTEAQENDPVSAVVSFTQAMTELVLEDPLPLKAVLQEIGPLNLSKNKTAGLEVLCGNLLEASGVPLQSAQEAGRMINYGFRGVLVSWAHGLVRNEDLEAEAKKVAQIIAEEVTSKHAPLN